MSTHSGTDIDIPGIALTEPPDTPDSIVFTDIPDFMLYSFAVLIAGAVLGGWIVTRIVAVARGNVFIPHP